MSIEFLPAIDLRHGKAVRLYQGDYTQETVYADDPVAIARQFAREGACWIHVVDLDAAKDGTSDHGELIAAIIRESGLRVELGGGVRSDADIDRVLSWGAERIVVGTAAAENPDWFADAIGRYPGHLVAGVDVRDGEVATRGWIESSGVSLDAFVDWINDAGPAGIVFTEISRDGAMQGPDLDGLRRVLRRSRVPVVASGGISKLDDLREVAALGAVGPLFGIISGRAIYEGAFTVADGVRVLQEQG